MKSFTAFAATAAATAVVYSIGADAQYFDPSVPIVPYDTAVPSAPKMDILCDMSYRGDDNVTYTFKAFLSDTVSIYVY